MTLACFALAACTPLSDSETGGDSEFEDYEDPTLRIGELQEGEACEEPALQNWFVETYTYDIDYETGEKSRFCHYRYEGTAEEAALVRNDAFPIDVWPDMNIVVALGALRDEYEASFASHFPAATGATASGAPGTPGTVLLTIVDTVPKGGTLDPDDHGGGLTYMAMKLLGTAAHGDVHTAQALTQVSGNFAPSGFLSDLAFALHQANQDPDVGTTYARQVINLSLGWLPQFQQCTPQGRLAGPMKEIYSVLMNVHADGNLVIAAGGNDVGSQGGTDFVLPAAWWEKGPDWPCDRSSTAPVATDDKVIFAVNAVDRDGAPVLRRGSTAPMFWAYGDHAVVETGGKPAYTMAMTGTSVASVVVSAAATAAWSRNPSLSMGNLMEDLHACAGESVDGDPGMSWIKVCEATGTACDKSTGSEPSVLPYDEAVSFASNATDPNCAGQMAYKEAGISHASMCPQQHMDTTMHVPHMVFGAPPSRDCPVCLFDKSGNLQLEFVNAPTTSTEHVLTLVRSGDEEHYALDDAHFGGMDSRLYLDLGKSFADVEAAYISAVSNGVVTYNALYLVH